MGFDVGERVAKLRFVCDVLKNIHRKDHIIRTLQRLRRNIMLLKPITREPCTKLLKQCIDDIDTEIVRYPVLLKHFCEMPGPTTDVEYRGTVERYGGFATGVEENPSPPPKGSESL